MADKMIMTKALLVWTIFWGAQETVLTYSTEQECKDAIERGLPYLNVPPKSELSCVLVADHPRVVPRPLEGK